MKKNFSVGYEQEGCSRLREPEQSTTGNRSPYVYILYKKEFFPHLNWNGVCEKKCIQRDSMTGMVAGYNEKKRKTKMAIFKILPCDWQPVECLEQWSNVFMSVLAEDSLRCVVLNFLQPVHLITVDVNEQRVAAVQPTEN